jgi:hypothetical protein
MHQLVTMFGPIPRLVLDELMPCPMFKKEGLKQTDEGGHKQLSMDPEAAQAGWYKFTLVPASQRYQSAVQSIKRHRMTCTNAWGPLWSTVIDDGKLGSSVSCMNIH